MKVTSMQILSDLINEPNVQENGKPADGPTTSRINSFGPSRSFTVSVEILVLEETVFKPEVFLLTLVPFLIVKIDVCSLSSTASVY